MSLARVRAVRPFYILTTVSTDLMGLKQRSSCKNHIYIAAFIVLPISNLETKASGRLSRKRLNLFIFQLCKIEAGSKVSEL